MKRDATEGSTGEQAQDIITRRLWEQLLDRQLNERNILKTRLGYGNNIRFPMIRYRQDGR